MASKKGRGHEKIMVESVWEAAMRPKASKTHICNGKMGICGEFIYVLYAFVCELGVRMILGLFFRHYHHCVHITSVNSTRYR